MSIYLETIFLNVVCSFRLDFLLNETVRQLIVLHEVYIKTFYPEVVFGGDLLGFGLALLPSELLLPMSPNAYLYCFVARSLSYSN